MMAEQGSTALNRNPPLCVDLDGTLILTDMLWESALQMVRYHPFTALTAPFWLLRGRAWLKRQIAANSRVDVASLPWNQPFLAWLNEQRAGGRQLILATAAEESLAREIADHLGIFDGIVASDGQTNLKGKNKAASLLNRFGADFDYAGNSGSDRAIWSVCRGIVAVETSRSLTEELRKSGRLTYESAIRRHAFGIWIRQLRIRLWTVNLVVFFAFGRHFGTALLCFGSYCLVASSAYIANDLLHLPDQRASLKRPLRPLASGELSIPAGVAAGTALFAAGMAGAAMAGTRAVWGAAVCFIVSWGVAKLAA